MAKKNVIQILIDEGADATFITHDAALKCHLLMRRRQMHISGFSATTSTMCSKETSFVLQSMRDNRKGITVRSALVKDGLLCQPLKAVHLQDRWKHLEDIALAEAYPRGPVDVDILVGSDCRNELLYGVDETPRFGSKNAPTAIPSIFGYLLQGPTDGNNTEASVLKIEILEDLKGTTDELLKRFWQLEEVPTTHTSGD